MANDDEAPEVIPKEELARRMGLSVSDFDRQIAETNRRPRILVVPGEAVSPGPSISESRGWEIRCDDCGLVPADVTATREEVTSEAHRHNLDVHAGAGEVRVVGSGM